MQADAQELGLLSHESPQSPQVSRRWIGAGAGAGLALVIVAIVAYSGAKHSLNVSTKGLVTTQLSNDFDLSSVSTISGMSPETQKAVQAAQLAAQTAAQKGAQSPLIDKTLQALSPKENLHDSNPCADDEELFESLCYAKCSILSAGLKPVRCAAHICEPLDSNGKHKCQLSQNAIESILSSPSLMPCHGYDVAGTREGKKRCPHTPGACLKDEELYLGTCFKQCSILTNGAFPHRKAFATCCKAESLFQCLMPGEAKTDKAFAEGGGFGDHDPDTPAKAHAPLQSLTESR